MRVSLRDLGGLLASCLEIFQFAIGLCFAAPGLYGL